ncbi:hypothetical protein CR513_03253, partial [Mucuna pruriens]
MIEDELPRQHEWVYAIEKGPTNWIVEVLLDQYFLKINIILMCEDPSQPGKPFEDESVEAEVLTRKAKVSASGRRTRSHQSRRRNGKEGGPSGQTDAIRSKIEPRRALERIRRCLRLVLSRYARPGLGNSGT